MKTLSNCNPIEFLQQTYKISEKASKLFSDTKVLEIRKNKPKFDGNETPDEIREKETTQAKKNIMEMLKCLMNDHPQETAEFLGLMCFVEPSDIVNHRGIDFITPALELISDPAIVSFLSQLAKLAN